MKASKLLLLPTLAILLTSCNLRNDITDISEDMFKGISLRSIGPGRYAGRISEILVDPINDSIIYVSPSTGGVFKTCNNGLSWSPIFDKAGTSLAIGDMDISNNNHNLIWVGTGEASGEQNPASMGDGIYKSADGGSTWVNMGLKETRHFSKVVIHPQDDNIVFAGATGSRWGSDNNRGVFKTNDGGNTWKKVLFINENTGISDIAIHPDGLTILASAWEQRRNAWAHVRTGPNSGLYKSEDNGENWNKIENGLPADKAGRIALAISQNNTNVIYACYEHDSLGLFRSDDKGISWHNVNNKVSTSYWYGRIYIDPNDEDHIFIMGTYIQESKDGGLSFAPINTGRSVHVDHHILWINPDNTDHLLLGNDGGLYRSYNKGANWTFIANLPIGQYYDISIDNRDPYWIYGGLQDNGVWGSPSRSISGKPVSNKDIISISGGDGFYSASDPDNPNIVYGESQFGFLVRFDQEKEERKRIRPKSPEPDAKYRFNWNTPFFISQHKPYGLYIGANKVLKTSDGGENWKEISHDLSSYTELDTVLVIGQKPTLKPYFTITALSESPIKKGLIYAGTDDGNLFVTKDDGENWENISINIPAPADRFFSRVVASAHKEGRAYIGFGRFYEANDISPYIFMTDDYGQSWTDISGDLPAQTIVRAIAEHPVNKDLLVLGTHNSLYISINSGVSWIRPETNLPYVAIDDIVIHNNDLVLGSYGRGLWLLDNINFLSELKPDSLNEEHILFTPRLSVSNICSDSIQKAEEYSFLAPEPINGLIIDYYLRESHQEGSKKYPQIIIVNSIGEETILDNVPANKGFNRMFWNPEIEGDYEIILKTGHKESRKKWRKVLRPFQKS